MAGVAGAGRPSKIKNPVETIANAVTPQIAPLPAPTSDAPLSGVPSSSVPAEPQLEASAEVNPFESELSAEMNPFEDAPVSADPMDDKIRATLGMPIEAAEQKYADENVVPSLTTRLKQSFAEDDKDFNSQALEQEFGKDNIKQASDGKFEVKVNGKWKKVGKDDSIFGMLADNAKMYTDTALTMAGGALGAIPGSIIPGAGTVAGGVVGAAGGGLLAHGVDKAAESMFFENRTGRTVTDAGLEMLGDMGTAGLLEGGGTVAAKGIGAGLKMTASGVKRAGEWAAKHEAAQALGSKLQGGLETLKGSVQQLLGMQDELTKAGYIKPIEGTDTFITASQTTPVSGKLAAELPDAVREVVEVQQDKILMTGVTKFFNQIGNFAKSSANIGERFAGKIDEWRKVEGAFIGNFEKQMIEASGDGSLKLASTVDAVTKLADEVGIVKNADGISGRSADNAADVDAVASMFSGNKSQARDMMRRVREMVIDLTNGENRMTMSELHKKYKTISMMTNNFTDEIASSGYGRSMIQLKNGLRDDMLRLGDAIMDGNAAYRQSRANYSQIKEGIDVFDDILKRDAVSSRVMARALFNGGKDGLQNLRTMKNLLMDRDPKLWKDMVGQFTRDTMEQATNAGKTNFSIVKKRFEAIGDEAIEELFGKKKGPLFRKFLGLAELVQKRPLKAGSAAEKSFLRQAIEFGDTGGEVLSMMNNGAVAEQVTREGIDNYVKNLGVSDPGMAKRVLEKVVETARKAAGLAAKSEDALVTAGNSVESGLGRAAIRTGTAAASDRRSDIRK